jgi:hypothetical protein
MDNRKDAAGVPPLIERLKLPPNCHWVEQSSSTIVAIIGFRGPAEKTSDAVGDTADDGDGPPPA